MEILIVLALYVIGGIAGGVLLGLVGVGMALVGVPLLVLTLPLAGFPPDLAPIVALATSMGIVTMGSVASVWTHGKLGNVNWEIVRRIAPYSVAGVLVGSLIASRFLPGDALRWALAIIELFIAWLMLRPRRPGPAPAPDPVGRQRAVAAAIGLSGSLIGAGGGVFMVPYLARQGEVMRRAVATSTTVGFPVTVIATLFYLFHASPEGHSGMLGMLYVPALLGLGIGSMIGAPFGAKLSTRMDSAKLKKGFGLLLIVLAISVVFA